MSIYAVAHGSFVLDACRLCVRRTFDAAATGRKDRRRDLRPRRRPARPSRSSGHDGARGDDACDAAAGAAEPCGDASAADDVWGSGPFHVRVRRAERQSM